MAESAEQIALRNEHYIAGRLKGREETLAALQRLRGEGECACVPCLREELGDVPGR